MKQYSELKAQAGDALLLFRMGDFYELFGEDAIEAARILEITLTSRDKNKANPISMAGVPHHSAQGYIQRLLNAGKKVAIGEQMEDPASVKGKAIVRREIIRTFTPGIQFDLDGAQNAYVAAMVPDGSDLWVLACLDASTGETLLGQNLTEEALLTELERLPIRHLLHLEASLPKQKSMLSADCLVEELPRAFISLNQATELLKRQYELESLHAFFNEDPSVLAMGLLIQYAVKTQRQERLAHLRLPAPLRRPQTLVLGPRTADHLDLLPRPDGTPSLYQLINRTRSALGARQLRRWLLAPLRNAGEIAARQSAVAALSQASERLSQEVAAVYDLERIAARVNVDLANPRDTLSLGRSLAVLGPIASAMPSSMMEKSSLLERYRSDLLQLSSALADLSATILETQREDAPLTSRDGGIFNRGADAELDRLLSLSSDGQKWLIELEAREKARTGIPSLKVRYNRVFGYYIEVTQAHLKSVPEDYQRKQTMVGAERFFTDELKKFEDDFLNASTRQKSLEQELFRKLLDSIRAKTSLIMDAARLLGELDALLAFSRLADEPGWTFPKIDDGLELSIEQGRHPMVDQATRGSFVPNDLMLSPEDRLTLMITGPNMGGKSTIMRQAALIVILGQVGAPVPAKSARWGAFSSVYTRIGAHDAIARGQSTFMVEMCELAHILHHADSHSLILLDEIGRGTSTYDGISVAWAALEWICRKIQARTLFATHYHELTRLSGTIPLLVNAHMAVEGARSLQGGSLRFLYELREGPANESFGIQVARIAGLPKPLIERAWEVLDELEKSHAGAAEETADTAQLSLFDKPATKEKEARPDPVLEELNRTDVNGMTPIQALNFIARLQEISRESRSTSA